MIHKYTYASGKLLRETVASGAKLETLDFSYDESGAPYSLRYTNGAGSTWSYHYLVNLQGDVIGLLNSTGDLVARYVYDAWGRPLYITDGKGKNVSEDPSHIANRNPLRYRGYYYDQETGFYYLQSRYYDPVLCRFVNADSFASTGQAFLGYNMYSYCNNCPVTLIDSEGGFPTYSTIVLDGGGGYIPDRDEPSSDVGAAEPYVNMPGSRDSNSPNCYAYAIGSSVNEQPGGRSGRIPTKWNDVNDVGKSVEADLRSSGKTVRIIDGPDAKVYENEFKIALRVGTTPIQYYLEYGYIVYDYHFMRQTNTGQWAEKHGTGGASVLWDVGMTPDTIPWTLNNAPYYDSDIIYYAIGN